jgi:hypothetical protein
LLGDLSFLNLLPKKPVSLLSEVAGGRFLYSGVALGAAIRFSMASADRKMRRLESSESQVLTA